jgi:GT2 family glycosyltransferase
MAVARAAVPAVPPTFVVIPMKDNVELTRELLHELWADGGYDAIFVYDNGSSEQTRTWLDRQARAARIEVVDAAGLTLVQMWNDAVSRARTRAAVCNIAFLNNDVRIGPCCIEMLSKALRADPSLCAVSPNYDRRQIDDVQYVSSTFKRRGMAGFAFMVRGEAFNDVAFDPAFEWWYADDDLVAQIESSGRRVGIVPGATVEHVNGGSQTVRYTKRILQACERDRRRMWTKWQHL